MVICMCITESAVHLNTVNQLYYNIKVKKKKNQQPQKNQIYRKIAK